MRIKIRVTINVTNVLVLLNSKNKTQTWLADRMSMTVEHLNRVINGKQPPGPKFRDRLQGALRGEKWDDLFSIKEDVA